MSPFQDADLQRLARMEVRVDKLEERLLIGEGHIKTITEQVAGIAKSIKRIEDAWTAFLKFVKELLKWTLGIIATGLGGGFAAYLVLHYVH